GAHERAPPLRILEPSRSFDSARDVDARRACLGDRLGDVFRREPSGDEELAVVDLARFLRQLPGKALPGAARGTVEEDPGRTRSRPQRLLRVDLKRRVERKRGALRWPFAVELRGLQTDLACDPKHLGKFR